MSYKTLESLFEKYSRIQMIGPVGSGKSRLLREFAENHPNVALSSTELQRRIQRALAPFWQKRFISLRFAFETEILFAHGALRRR